VLLVELKIVKALDDTHRLQCTNYLKRPVSASVCCSISANHDWKIKRVVNGL